jgi:hypothetical protein
MVQRPSSSGDQTGIIKYSRNGLAFEIDKRRENAIEQIKAICNGKYKIISDKIETMTSPSGGPVEYKHYTEFIKFRCSG